MLTCHDVAKYFLNLMDINCGDLMSNLKLQKLVYYAQGLHLSIFDAPLFNEPMEAWTHGPAVPELYWYYYNRYGSGPIPKPANIDLSVYTSKEEYFLGQVYFNFARYSAAVLQRMTQREAPWKDAIYSKAIITHEALKKHFLQTAGGK